MFMFLSLLGSLVAGAGIVTIGFGIPISEFSLGTTLIIAGTIALTSGLVLIGLATVVGELNRLSEAPRARPAARPARPPADAVEPASAPAAKPAATGPPPSSRPAPPQTALLPRPRLEAPGRDLAPATPRQAVPSSVEVSAAAIERLRSSIPRADRPKAEPAVVAEGNEVPLSPNGSAVAVQREHPAAVETGSRPKVAPQATARSGDSAEEAVDAQKGSRLDFLFRSKPARPAPSENFDAFWPADGHSASSAPRDSEPRHEESAKPAALAAPPSEGRHVESAPEPNGSGAVAILKSGVVDGMAYTLYADGSIEAKLPHGTVRFGSIAELRAHIENNS